MTSENKNIYEIIKENNKDIINLIEFFIVGYNGNENPEDLKKKLNIFKEYNDNIEVKVEYPTAFFDQFERNSRNFDDFITSEELKKKMPVVSDPERVKKLCLTFSSLKIYASQKESKKIELEFEIENFFVNKEVTVYKLKSKKADINYNIVLNNKDNASKIAFSYETTQSLLTRKSFLKYNKSIEDTLEILNEKKINIKKLLLKDNETIKNIKDLIELEKLSSDTSITSDFFSDCNLFITNDLIKLIDCKVSQKIEITPQIKEETLFQKIKKKFN